MFDKITVSELTTWLLSFVFLALCITPFGLLLFRFVLQWGFFLLFVFKLHPLFIAPSEQGSESILAELQIKKRTEAEPLSENNLSYDTSTF